ncbi:MAG TPA: hypothetical protein VND64_23650 [Pirellulales bacterium]|nr:hypothetical protein [Pirellulales bacterium]
MKRFIVSFAIALSVSFLCASWAQAQDEEDEALDPIGELALAMEEVVVDLSGLNTGKDPTQEAQEGIVGKLDELIAKLEKECEQCRGGSVNTNPNKPAQVSGIRSGPGGIGDLHAARQTGKNWAELPAHQRDKIMQSMTEGFPAHYQKILERYYKRLAEEKAAPDADDSDEDVDDADTDEAPAASKTEKAPAKTGKTPVKAVAPEKADAKKASGKVTAK